MNLCKYEDCTGCSACVSICPRNAISLQYDERGFLRPVINKNICIDCKLCAKLCERLNNHMEEENHKKFFYLAYATKIKDEEKRIQSQSGGLFSALAEIVLEKKGVVYGAGFDEKNHVKHLRITELDELEKLKGSKYVQSDINNSFKSILEDLKNNKIVLFSGTPCQVAGIESLLDVMKINKENFYSCDLICHGVPSPKIYEDYLKFLESKRNDTIEEFNFRDKTVSGWHNHAETYKFSKENEKITSIVYRDLFYSNLALRQSCEHCKYTSKNRAGDITIGDCWGIEKIAPDLWNDNKGISICLIQTEHGKKLFDLAKEKMDVFELNSDQYEQPNMKSSSRTPLQKNKFWKDYKKISFEKLLKKYTIYGGVKFKIKRKVLNRLNKW